MDVASKLHDLASDPCVYDFLKKFSDRKSTQLLSTKNFHCCQKRICFGCGGHGSYATAFPKTRQYSCLDMDQKNK